METTPTPQPATTTTKWYTNPDNLLKIFQVILGISTLFYIAGYLSWAAFAYHNGLGFLPALREQYVIAGVVPVFTILFILMIVPFVKMLIEFVSKRYTLKSTWIRITAILVLVVFAVNVIQFIYSSHNNVLEDKLIDLFFNALFLIALMPGLAWMAQNYNNRIVNMFLIYVLTLTILSGISIFRLYISFIFPSLPREFGGPKAEPYTFDVNRTELSDKTLSMICEDDWVAENNGQNVYSTDTLYLIFDSDEYLLLKKYDRDLGKDNPLIKLKTSCVRAQFPIR